MNGTLESHQDQMSKSWDLVHRLPNRYDLAIGKFHREDLFLKYILKLSKSQMAFCYQNCSDVLWEKIALVIEKNFRDSRLKAEIWFLRSLEHFFLTVRQNNFGNKIPFLGYCKIFTSLPSFASRCSNCSVIFQRLFLNVFSKDTLKELRKIVYKM